MVSGGSVAEMDTIEAVRTYRQKVDIPSLPPSTVVVLLGFGTG